MMDFNQDLDVVQRHEVISYAVERLLTTLPSGIAQAIRLSAIPHWVDRDILLCLVDDEDQAHTAYLSLQQLSFTRQDQQGRLYYLTTVREYLLKYWEKEERSNYREANQALSAYFTNRLDEASVREYDIYQNEILYHRLIVDEEAGIAYLCKKFEQLCHQHRLDLAETFVMQAVEQEKFLSALGQKWVSYFIARLDLTYKREERGETTFQDLADTAPSATLRGIALWSLGQVRVDQYRWSEAISLYKKSLVLLEKDCSWHYAAKVKLAFGDAYQDLADHSGGLFEENEAFPTRLSYFLYLLQHLPFLIYEWFVHRISFFPNWYFGTNYQNWIIAYLLTEATQWYKKSETQLNNYQDSAEFVEIELALASLEHKLGRWSRAEMRYQHLLEQDFVTHSLYRTASVQLGQGKAWFKEGKLEQAKTALSIAKKSFYEFHDHDSIGTTAYTQGKIYTTLEQFDKAISAYTESIQAYTKSDNLLKRTTSVSALENLTQRQKLPETDKQQVTEISDSIKNRQYVVRFPNTLHLWFTQIAFWIALPLTYLVASLIGLGLTFLAWTIEGTIRFIPISEQASIVIINSLAISAFGISLILATLWFYRFAYSVIGVAFVRFLGRRLVNIEKNPPSYILTDETSLRFHLCQGADKGHIIQWADIAQFISVDYYQGQRPLSLISQTVLPLKSGTTVAIDAITTGYQNLKRDIGQHLAQLPNHIQQKNVDPVILGRYRILIFVCIALLIALLAREGFRLEWRLEEGEQHVFTRLTDTIALFIPTLLLLIPSISLLRLIFHQKMIQRLYHYQSSVIPSRLMWLMTALFNLGTISWFVILILINIIQ